ncbi:DeoR/GlpR family DNA-binding transcription regulator [Paenibacillus koleovorans]|uniref:DeoR/GlpR family DNA-binding transcription regulator n=1 Tax=Paenibacillus koleovorans TaxID=121608 RepID=UPI000FD86C6E|nr:DeoR/GlpR family DNA-binding transcription regulator [Paenibacillus koleovorans]
MKPRLNERQETILTLLHEEGEVKIAALSKRFDVTEMTIRRDLEKLEQLSLLFRTLGGAIPAASADMTVSERSAVYTEEKSAIGRLAASLIQPGDAVFIDAGTTTLQIARALPRGFDATIVTNALNVAAELMGKQIQTIVVGGILREATSSLVGPHAEELIAKMAFDKVFIGASGFTVEHGFSNSNVFEAEVKRLAMAQAGEVVIVLDHTKFGIRSLASFASLGHANRIVTDRRPPEGIVEACQEASVQISIPEDV